MDQPNILVTLVQTDAITIKQVASTSMSMGQFFCVGLGSMFCILCLDLCLQTYVLRKMKTARFMLCLSQNIT